MASTVTAKIQVRTYELDSFGHVNNSVYLNYMEEARSEFLKQMGVSFHDFGRYGVQLVIVEAHIKYVNPCRYGDTIDIAMQIRDVSLVTSYIDYTMTNTASGQSIADAWTRAAFIRADTGKPTRAPVPFQEAFRTFSGS